MSIEKLRELEKAATPGPWHCELRKVPDETIRDCAVFAPDVDYPATAEVYVTEYIDEADAALIAAVRNALPALLDVADELTKVRRWLEANMRPSPSWENDADKFRLMEIDRALDACTTCATESTTSPRESYK